MTPRPNQLVALLVLAVASSACGAGDGSGSQGDGAPSFPTSDIEPGGATDLVTPIDDAGGLDDAAQDSAHEVGPSDGALFDLVGPLDAEPDGPDATEPDATEPDVAQPQPDVAQPQPDVAQPQPDVAEPQPDVAEPQPDVAEPQPDVAEPQPDVAEPEPEPEPEPAYNLCGTGKDAPRPPGTWEEPIDAPFMPFVDEGDTLLSFSDQANIYDCKLETLEYGPEVVYRFTAEHAGDFRAEVVDPVGPDIDLHLLQDPQIDENGTVTGCLARAHEVLVYDDLPAGDYWLVADSWTSASTGTEYPGAYRIAWEVVSPNVWSEVAVREGVTWSRARLENAGTTQTVNVVRFEPWAGWDLQPHLHAGCQTTAQGLVDIDGFAGVNGNFFAACTPTDLLKEDGVLHTTNATTNYAQRTAGWSAPDDVAFAWLEPGLDWPQVPNAIGGYPSLVAAGVALAEAKPGQQVWSETDWSEHPRTIMGIDSTGAVVMATFDARTDAGDGFTTPALATWVAQELDLVDAINLDGGGSTTMVVHDCWMNHTVSFPSDNDLADHHGLRSVASGLYLR